MLEIRLFGTPEFRVGDQPLPRLTQSPTLTKLLAYLAIHANRRLARSVLAALFWPDRPEPTARQNLNIHLCRLRKILRPFGPTNFLLCDRETVGWDVNAPFWLDIAEFEQAAAILPELAPDGCCSTRKALGRLENAVGLYRGAFLEGFYDDWCLNLREQFREQYLTMLEILGRTYYANGHYPASLQAAQRLADEDPTREEADFRLIHLYILLNRLPDAFKQYERYCAIWRKELKVGPSARMQTLVQGLNTENMAAEGQPFLPVDLEHENLFIEQLFAALELMPDARGSTASYRLHMLLWPQIAYYCERRGWLLKTHGSDAAAETYLDLATLIRAWLNGPTGPLHLN
jgi:DNA-binding SARP family transcriptional activator